MMDTTEILLLINVNLVITNVLPVIHQPMTVCHVQMLIEVLVILLIVLVMMGTSIKVLKIQFVLNVQTDVLHVKLQLITV